MPATCRHAGDRAGVDAALGGDPQPILRDYPTVAQLQQVLLAEQSRLDGKNNRRRRSSSWRRWRQDTAWWPCTGR